MKTPQDIAKEIALLETERSAAIREMNAATNNKDFKRAQEKLFAIEDKILTLESNLEYGK